MKQNGANYYRTASEVSRETMQEIAFNSGMDADEQARVEAALILLNMARSG